MSTVRRWLLLAALATGAIVRADPMVLEPPAPTAHVLFLAGRDGLDETMARRLAETGIATHSRPLEKPLSAAYLRLFEAVVVVDFVGPHTRYILNGDDFLKYYRNMQRNLSLLDAYLREGGGLWLTPTLHGGGGTISADAWNRYLKKWGATILPRQVRDDAHTTELDNYAWTTQIHPHPVTEGVRSLLYPINLMRWDDAYSTVPLRLEAAEWTPLVRSMPSSQEAWGLQSGWIPVPEASSKSVIVAVRQVGKGRLLLSCMSDMYIFSHPFMATDQEGIDERHTGIIDGIFLDKGVENHSSDGWRFVHNGLRWLAEAGQASGFGGYSAETAASIDLPAPLSGAPWGASTPEAAALEPIKLFIGARSAYSDGTGSIADYAKAARRAGYGILVMAETFEHTDRAGWQAYLKACDDASDDDLKVLPGFDIGDPYNNRFLIAGTRHYPRPYQLDADGKRIVETPYIVLGFGNHFSAILRPSTTPLPHELYKFYSGIAVRTYREGKMVDNGLLAYQWSAFNFSRPLPIAVHETYSPEELATHGATGLQTYIRADTPANATLYLRADTLVFFNNPPHYFVSSGPLVRDLNRNRAILTAASPEAPIKEVRLMSDYVVWKRWLHNDQRVEQPYLVRRGVNTYAYLHVVDAAGGEAITPSIGQVGTPGGVYRCSDRQNWLGEPGIFYTGTQLADVNPILSSPASKEGEGIFAAFNEATGVNLAPRLSFPVVGNGLTLTHADLGLRWYDAKFHDIAMDARPSHGTAPSRIFDGYARFYNHQNMLAKEPVNTNNMYGVVREVVLRTKIPIVPDWNVFPTVSIVSVQPVCLTGKPAEYAMPAEAESATAADADDFLDLGEAPAPAANGRLTEPYLDLPVGAAVDDIIVLSPGMRVSVHGRLGFKPPETHGLPVPVGTEFRCRYVKVPKEAADFYRYGMGFGQAPYTITLRDGEPIASGYVQHFQAENGVLLGDVTPAAIMPFRVPLRIDGLHAGWTAGIMRGDGEFVAGPVFEGSLFTHADMRVGGALFAGHPVQCDHRELRLDVLAISAELIRVAFHNPTDSAITTRLLIADLPTIQGFSTEPVSVPAGTTLPLANVLELKP